MRTGALATLLSLGPLAAGAAAGDELAKLLPATGLAYERARAAGLGETLPAGGFLETIRN